MNELHEDLDRALRAVTFGEAPVERTRRDGRRLRTRRRVAVLAGVVAVAVVAVGVPVLGRGIAAPPPAPLTRPDPVVTDGLPPGTARAPGGLASKTGVVAQGKVGAASWQVTVHPPGADPGVPCVNVSSAGKTLLVLDCSITRLQAAGLGSDPAALSTSGVGPAEVTLGVVAAQVSYLAVTFTDGQWLKLIPVTVSGHRYVAWTALESMTVASVVAHLGGPYADNGLSATAVPFDRPGGTSAFGLWLTPGQAAPPRGHGFLGHGTAGGQAWSITAYEGPWGTCFADSTGSLCLPVRQLATTAVQAGFGSNPAVTTFVGSAAPGVALLRFTLSDGTTIQVKPVPVGDERLFAFGVRSPVTAIRYTAYNAAGQVVATGPVPK